MTMVYGPDPNCASAARPCSADAGVALRCRIAASCCVGCCASWLGEGPVQLVWVSCERRRATGAMIWSAVGKGPSAFSGVAVEGV